MTTPRPGRRHPGSGGAELAELTRELEREAEVEAEAEREIAEVLNARP